MELLFVIAGLTALGLAFLGIDRSSAARLRRAGPWLLALALCSAYVIAVPPTLEPYSWSGMKHPEFSREMVGGFGFLLSFGIEAVLISRVLLRVAYRPLVFLASFVGVTLVGWFATLMVWTAVMPDS